MSQHIPEIQEYIYSLWNDKKLSFAQIAQMQIPNFLSLKTVRNICYGKRPDFNNKTKFGIYIIHRLKYLGNHNINKSIYFAYENQPPRRYTERQIRNIIKNKLKPNL